MEHTYNDLELLYVELSAYRRNALTVRIDLGKKILQWKDNYQWSNNFVRSLTPENIRLVRDCLPRTQLFTWPLLENEEDSQISRDTIWQVTLCFSDGSISRYGGEKIFPVHWDVFRDMIEGVARIPFKIRGWK